MAGIYNFTIEQGAWYERVITWRDANDALVNLTGYSARMKIKDSDSGTTLLSLTTTPTANGDVLTLGGAAGTITITISSTTTTTMSFREALYDLELIPGSGRPKRLLKGRVDLDEEVTT